MTMGSKGRDAVSGDYRRLRDNRWCSSQVQIQRTGNTYTDNASRMVSEGDRCGVAGSCGYEPAEICFSLDGNVVRAEAGTGFYSKIDLGIVKYHFELGAGGQENADQKISVFGL